MKIMTKKEVTHLLVDHAQIKCSDKKQRGPINGSRDPLEVTCDACNGIGHRMGVEDMSCAAIDMKPVDFDWSDTRFQNEWDFVEANRCEKCNVPVALMGYSGGDRHYEIAANCECDGHLPESSSPMMSYWYPCPIDDTQEAAKLLVDTPLCVVFFEEGQKTGLALTGGGMDLSWEICEAFMLLGFLPPLHFAELPGMAGRGTSERDKWIIKGCLRSCKVAEGWAKSKASRLRDMIAKAKEPTKLIRGPNGQHWLE